MLKKEEDVIQNSTYCNYYIHFKYSIINHRSCTENNLTVLANTIKSLNQYMKSLSLSTNIEKTRGSHYIGDKLCGLE